MSQASSRFASLPLLAIGLAVSASRPRPSLPATPLDPRTMAWLLPLLIFLALTANNAIDTLRMLSVARGRRAAAWLAGFTQSILFVTAAAGLLLNLHNGWNLAAFAAGFAFGTVLGIWVESRLAPGHALVRVFSSGRGASVVQALRDSGRGATEVPGRGQDGTVSLILCHVPRREADAVRRQVTELDPQAFVSSENVRLYRGGWRA